MEKGGGAFQAGSKRYAAKFAGSCGGHDACNPPVNREDGAATHSGVADYIHREVAVVSILSPVNPYWRNDPAQG